MSTRRKITFGILGVYIFGMIAIVAIFGATRNDNEAFSPQNEFKLDPWLSLPGPMDLNKGVLYLFIATSLTLGIMLFIFPSACRAARTARRPRSSGPTRACATRS